MKKAMTLFLALTLALMMALPVLAEETKTGSITVTNAVKGQLYSIYRILDLESYGDGAYAYKPNSDWKAFIEDNDIQGVYLTINDDGYVDWAAEDKADNGAAVKAFAEKAKTYAKTNGIAAVATQIATGDTVEFAGLDLGYYLVDSTLGAVCSLDTTQPDVSMEEKNVPPTNVKEVQEDSTTQFGDKNDADIGQEITFKSTITVNANNKGYVFHDKMSEGLTFTGVKTITVNGYEEPMESKNYTIKTTGLTDGCTFEVVFTSVFCETLEAQDKIIITYTAKLNDKAKVGVQGNPNESWLEYGESSTASSSTVPSETITYTWDMEVLKYANGKEDNVLKGVQFVLLNKAKTLVATVENGNVTGWTDVPAEDAEWPAASILTTDKDGKISIKGLDADTYYLKEIKTLAGFNMLANPVEVVITGKTDGTYQTLIKKIENNSGVEMPSTGGIGTTIFYVAGGLLVAVAVVLLVTKKKMSAAK